MLFNASVGFRPYPVGLNKDSAQAQGLVAWYPFWPDLLTTYGYARLDLIGPSTSLGACSIGGLGMLTTAVATSGLERQGIAPNNVCISAPPFTVAIWVNPKDAVTAATLWSAAGTGFTGWYLNMSGGNYGWQALSGSSGIAIPSRSVLQNKWQHLTGVELSANSRACYLDGANKGTDTTSVSVTLPSNAVESIGKYDAPGGGTGNNLNGTMADVRVYNRALTDAEVWELYDPRSRWDLYWQPNTRAYSFMSAAAAGTAGYLLVKN